MNEEQVTRFRHVRSGYSVETSKLIDRLEHGEVGDIITDEELEKVCGLPTGTGGKAYGYLGTAIRHWEREGVVWCRVPYANVIKRYDPEEIMIKSEGDRKRVRKLTKRSMLRLGSIEVQDLSEEERRKFNTISAIVGTIALMSDTKTRKKLEARGVQNPMDIQKMLEVWPNPTEHISS